MMPLLTFVALSAFGAPKLKIADIACAPKPKLERLMGPSESSPHAPGIYFHVKGFNNIRVNGVGDQMSDVLFNLNTLVSWKEAVNAFGLDGKTAKAKPLPVAPSPIPLNRNLYQIEGFKGLPPHPKSHKAWKLLIQEYAVVNKDRARAMRGQIQSAQGTDRMRLIQSCYDWATELHFSAN